MKTKRIRILLLFLLAFLFGNLAAYIRTSFSPQTVPTAAEGNWGLSFQQDGEPPVANASFEELKKYIPDFIPISADKKTNIDELKWLTDTVLASAAAWKSTGWAYIADCSQMSPVGPAEGGYLVEMTKKFVEAGCKAFAFAEGKSVMLKVQAIFMKSFKKSLVLQAANVHLTVSSPWIPAAV